MAVTALLLQDLGLDVCGLAEIRCCYPPVAPAIAPCLWYKFEVEWGLSQERKHMVVEWLRFRVDEPLRDQFVREDEAIWTAVLSRYSGFLKKEVWISADNLEEIIAVIHWETYELWQSIPQNVLDETEAAFQAAMGEGTYELLEGKKYQVRKVTQG
ncbi:MAG: TIGR03792 family protein [Synechococcales bacterium]|nr:TIGR03792 family protein [Synechococcales bacterium]